jgi:hypothetical protein
MIEEKEIEQKMGGVFSSGIINTSQYTIYIIAKARITVKDM